MGVSSKVAEYAGNSYLIESEPEKTVELKPNQAV